jgi:hypothetical protein
MGESTQAARALNHSCTPWERFSDRQKDEGLQMTGPALAQCCICRTTTKLLDEGRPLPEGWLYRTITVDVGRFYCPEDAHRA